MPVLKGIVVTSARIERDIDRIDNEPLDQADIAKLWKVYTTTQRRLLDPTAERLENLWWRIWGSRKKQLKGAVVARLFAQISDGQSFVPLGGSLNGDEGIPSANTAIRHGPGTSSATALHHQNHSRPSTTSSSTASKAPVSMPHPILKKTRGPSATGPRPTARFISPHESQDDSDSTSLVSPNAHVVVQPPSGPSSPSTGSQETRSDKKSTTPAKKKAGFVASKGRRRRPLVGRRQSSQTSQSSTESPAKSYDVTHTGTSTHSSSERSSPSFAEHSRKMQPRFQENLSLASGSAASKKPVRKRESLRSSDAKSSSPKKASRESQKDMVREDEIVATGDPGPSHQPHQIENNQELNQNRDSKKLEEIEIQKALLEQANARLRKGEIATEITAQDAKQPSRALQRVLRSRSEGKLSSKGKGVASLAPTLTAVSGQMDLTDSSDAPPKSRSSSASLAKGKDRDPDDLRRAEMFTKRPVPPIQPAVDADTANTLSRSKSQLTLLLERDRARTGEKKTDKSRGNGPKGGG